MRRFLQTCLATSLAVLVQAPAHAQYLSAIRPIPGYICMRLNLPREQLLSKDLDIPIYTGPTASAPRLGTAAAALIVKSPMVVNNGFAEVLFLDGRPGWIKASLLGPYATPGNPNARCTPSIMSNGRPGFG